MAILVLQALKLSKQILPPATLASGFREILKCRLNRLAADDKNFNLSDATENEFYEDEEDKNLEQERLMKIRNKSRLTQSHQNIVHGNPPYSEPLIPYHETIKYKRKLYARYGQKSGVNPGILWPTRKELAESIEYEKVSHPDSLQLMVSRAKLELEKKNEERRQRENELNLKIAKLEKWKSDVEEKAQKKLMEAQAAKDRKERLVEEVRRYFGFKVDPRDERFKQMLEQKEKEESKKAKAERKKVKQAKLLAKLIETEKIIPASNKAATPAKESV